MASFLRSLSFLLIISSVALGQGTKNGNDGFRTVKRSEDYDHKWALIVGTNYEEAKKVNHLENAESDAKAIRDLLTDSYGFNCELLLGKDAIRAKITALLTRYEREIGENDCFLFYFAGHGTSRDDIPVLFPSDVEADGEVANTLPAYEVIRKRIKARHSLYIFDSCYSGDIVNIKFNGLQRRQGKPNFESRSLQIITSSANNQTAKDGSNGRSPFARQLINGFRQQSGDRIPVTSLQSYISQKLKEQDSQFESFIFDSAATSGGEFMFIGERPVDPKKTIVYQTLGGSHSTLAGSPLSRSWFEESPWLTPGLRLILDGEISDSRGYFGTKRVENVTFNQLSLNELLGNAKSWLEKDPSIDESIIKTYLALKTLPDAKNKASIVQAVLSDLNIRDVETSPTNLHSLALLQCAKMRYLNEPSSDESSLKINDLFLKAEASYAQDDRIGLRLRCLADHANWLLEKMNYDDAIRVYSQALSLSKDLSQIPYLQIELYSGAAYACRKSAKNFLSKGATASPDERAQAKKLWSESHSYYENLKKSIDEFKLPANDPIRAYLHERLAWLNMDLWNLTEARYHFTNAISLREKADSNLVAFLCYANSKQGVAMVDQLMGKSGKEALEETISLVERRLNAVGEDSEDSLVLYARLCNTIERLGDCDFLPGGHGMLSSTVIYRKGLDVCDSWLLASNSASERESIRIQRLRFLSKIIIAASTSGRIDLSRNALTEFNRDHKAVEVEHGVLLILSDFALACAEYCESSLHCDNSNSCQNAVDIIRKVIQKHSVASLDRETAEVLLMMSRVVADIQQRQDAILLRKLLPKDLNGNPPANMTTKVREQYDRVVRLQGVSYNGSITSWSEYEVFRDLILNIQANVWSRSEKSEPHVIFYFPIDGSNGLLIMSKGLEDGRAEIFEIGFGWKEIGSLQQSVEEKLHKFLKDNLNTKIVWSNDVMLNDAGFKKTDCPFIN